MSVTVIAVIEPNPYNLFLKPNQRIRKLIKPYEEERRELLILRISNASKSMDAVVPFSSTVSPVSKV